MNYEDSQNLDKVIESEVMMMLKLGQANEKSVKNLEQKLETAILKFKQNKQLKEEEEKLMKAE